MNCLGIDIGSSSIKGAVLNLATGRLGPLVRAPFPAPLPGRPAGWFEVDPDQVVAAVRQVVLELSDSHPPDRILFSGQMGGVTLADAQCRALTPYISWRDQRTLEPMDGGDSYVSQLADRLDPRHLAEVGQELKPGSMTSLLFWLAQHGQLPSGAVPLSLGDYVVCRLCDCSPHTEPTEAIGMVDLARRQWHLGLRRQLGLDALEWPPLVDVLSPVGQMQLGDRQVSCHPVVGDHQCALLGIGLQPNELSINISTGSQVSQLTAELCLGSYQTRCFFGGQYLNTITHLPAGRSLNVLVDLVTEISRTMGGAPTSEPWPYIAREAARAEDSLLQVDLAFFAGPMGSSGSVQQITVENLTVGSLFRAAFRNMADNYALCARQLVPAGDWTSVVLSGGLSQRVPLLAEFIRQCLPGTYRECPEAEDTLLGLLDLARRVHHAPLPVPNMIQEP